MVNMKTALNNFLIISPQKCNSKLYYKIFKFIIVLKNFAYIIKNDRWFYAKILFKFKRYKVC